MRAALLVALGALVGCVTVRDLEEVGFTDRVSVITASHGRGDLSIAGAQSVGGADVAAWAWGRGANRDAAAERQERVRWSAELTDEVLALESFALDRRAGVDFVVTAPRAVDTVLRLDEGAVLLDRVEGFHDIVASRVTGNASGDVVISTTSTVNLDFFPYEVTASTIDAGGSVTLGLPFGLEYDLVIRGNPGQELVVDELGWDDVRLGDGFFSGFRGRGLVRINIFADGRVQVRQLR